MSHEVDTMFSVRELPWHGLGKVPDHYPADWNECRELAGITWDPVESDLYSVTGMDSAGNVEYAKEPGVKAIKRSDNDFLLGVTNESYPLIDHTALGRIADAVLAHDTNVLMTTGGSLENGRLIWVLFMLDEPIKVSGDPSLIMPYVRMSTRHDGSGAVNFASTSIRVVCRNTFDASDTEARGNNTVASIRHTANWEDRVQAVRQAIEGTRKHSAALADWFNTLAGIKVTDDQVKEFVDLTFYPEDRSAVISPTVQKNILTAVNRFYTAYRSPTCEGIQGTAYGVMQAMTEYLDHLRPVQGTGAQRRDRVTGRMLMGDGKLKFQSALRLGDVIGEQLVTPHFSRAN